MLKAAVLLCLLGAVVSGPLGPDDDSSPVSRSPEEVNEYREYLISTRSGKNSQQSPNASIWENSGKYQGDIILDDEQIDYLVEQYSGSRNGYIRPGILWPQNTVVYEFAAGHFDNNQRNHILHAMQVISDRTCIRFRPRANNEFNYALITSADDGCYASVGYWNTRGVHTINLARNGCLHTVVIVHEWLHVIGFFHMQSTYNRYDWVRINWENIYPGMAFNFDRYDSSLVSNVGLPYEYESCMHYNSHAFSFNGRPTMDALWAPNSAMGPMTHITGWDFLRVDRLYRCQAWRKPEEYLPYYVDPKDGSDL